jgi:hypothetical protein
MLPDFQTIPQDAPICSLTASRPPGTPLDDSLPACRRHRTTYGRWPETVRSGCHRRGISDLAKYLEDEGCFDFLLNGARGPVERYLQIDLNPAKRRLQPT